MFLDVTSASVTEANDSPIEFCFWLELEDNNGVKEGGGGGGGGSVGGNKSSLELGFFSNACTVLLPELLSNRVTSFGDAIEAVTGGTIEDFPLTSDLEPIQLISATIGKLGRELGKLKGGTCRSIGLKIKSSALVDDEVLP